MVMQRIEPRQPNIIDVEVGRLVRVLRMERGLTQRKLASHIGVGFQQLQHYETGRNRISMDRLTRIAKALKVDVIFLLYRGRQTALALSRSKRAEVTEGIQKLGQIGAARLLRAFLAIPSEPASLRESIVRVVESVAVAEYVRGARKPTKRRRSAIRPVPASN